MALAAAGLVLSAYLAWTKWIAASARCDAAGVRRYPTWVVGGRRYEGLMTLEELARASGFAGRGSTR